MRARAASGSVRAVLAAWLCSIKRPRALVLPSEDVRGRDHRSRLLDRERYRAPRAARSRACIASVQADAAASPIAPHATPNSAVLPRDRRTIEMMYRREPATEIKPNGCLLYRSIQRTSLSAKAYWGVGVNIRSMDLVQATGAYSFRARVGVDAAAGNVDR